MPSSRIDRRPNPRTLVRVLTVVLLLLGVAALAPAPAAASPTLPAQAAGSVAVSGHGWGHGRGMGQYGAKGYADNQGWNHVQILSHFYSNTNGNNPVSPAEEISVWLKAGDGQDLWIYSDKPVTVTGDQTVTVDGTVRIANEGGQWVLRSAARVAGTNCRTDFGAPTPLGSPQFPVTVAPTVADPGTQIWDMLGLCGANGAIKHYRGKLQIHQTSTRRTVNVVAIDQYLKGVVPRESPSSWNLEALKAQAVAARSYALSEGNRFGFAETCDDTQCQVYGGAANNGVALEPASTNNAIAQTAGQVRRFSNGALARTEFSSSTGGWTSGTPQCSACSFPTVEDVGDSVSPYHNWSVDIPKSTIESRWGIGTYSSTEILSRNGVGAEGGRVLSMRLNGSTRSVTITGDEFRQALGLRSNWFSVGGPSGPPPRPTCGYSDVFEDDQFCNDITWLTEEDIANGYPDGPSADRLPVSRQAMAAFLYRFVTGNGDAPACTSQPFSDVPVADQFCGEIAWLAGSGITGGFQDGTFRPLEPVSRQAMASFLYRVEHGPVDAPACGGQPFNDVPAADQFCGEIKWLADTEIAAGYPDGGFHPTAAVSRQAMARFLHELDGLGA